MQISTNGYVAFGHQTFDVYTSTDFPIKHNNLTVSIIAPFWNDLELIKPSSKFYYQLHANRTVLRRASDEIRLRMGKSFYPNHVLVVTWFKINRYEHKECTFTFQLALAWDASTTYAFYLYNTIQNTFGETTVGWQEGPTNGLNFVRNTYSRSDASKMVVLRTKSNVNKPGEWIYNIGERLGNYPIIHILPVITVKTFQHGLRFECILQDNITDFRSVYEVSWYAQNKKSLNKTDVLVYGQDRSTFQNSLTLNTNEVRFRLGQEIYCIVRSWFSDTPAIKSRYYESAKFFAGIEIRPRKVIITEDSIGKEIKLTLTVPLVCADASKNCSVEISFEQDKEDVFLSSCTFDFIPTGERSKTLIIYPKQDFIDDGLKNIAVKPVLSAFIKVFDWKGYEDRTPLLITTNNVPSASCSSTGDPYIKTFDGIRYSFFSSGDFVLVQSLKRNMKVHIRTFDCSQSVTCNCAVAAQEKDDVVAIDMCNSSKPHFKWPTGHKPSDATTLESVKSKYFEINFSSGLRIKFNVQERANSNSFANIYVEIPSIYRDATFGLCGLYDGNLANDIMSKNGSIYRERDPANSSFVYSWKLRNGTSLFFKKSGTKRCKRSTVRKDEYFCICKRRDGTGVRSSCVYETTAVHPQFNMKTDRKTIMSAAFANCPSRKKRAVSNVIVVPDEGDDTIYEYDPPDREFVLPTWPTKSGKTFSEVEQFCNESIFNSTTGKVCSVTLRSDFDVAAFRNECISDIQLSDSYEFVKSVINVMSTSCEDVVLKNVKKYWEKTDNGTLEPPVFVANSICVNDCSGNGECMNGSCVCNDAYVGSDCSILKGSPPIVVEAKHYCDTRKHECYMVSVTGRSIVDSLDVTCTIILNKTWSNRPAIGSHSNIEGTLVSFAEVLCTLPLPTISVSSPLKIYDLYLSHDEGNTRSVKKVMHFVYDSKCVYCTKDVNECVLKNSTCFINNYCYVANEANPSNSDEYCNPKKDACNFTIGLIKRLLIKLNQTKICKHYNVSRGCVYAEEMSQSLVDILKHGELLTSLFQVQLVSDIISAISKDGNITKKTFSNTFYVINNLWNAKQEAILKTNETWKITYAFEEMAKKISEVLMENKQNFSLTGRNIAVSAAFIKQNDTNIIAVRKSDGGIKVIISNTGGLQTNNDHFQASMHLPSQTFSYKENFVYSFSYFKKPFFVSAVKNSLRASNSSIVLYVGLAKKNFKNFKIPIILKFKSIGKDYANENCAFWKTYKESSGMKSHWSTEGCVKLSSEPNLITCKCHQLGYYALVLKKTLKTSRKPLELGLVTWIGCGIAIMFIAITVTLLLVFRKSLQKQDTRFMLCICLSLVCLLLVFVSGVSGTSSSACRTVAALLQYFTLTTFCWVFLYALRASQRLVGSAQSEKGISLLMKNALFAFGVPLLIVVISPSAAPRFYGSQDFCVVHGAPFYVGVLVPVIALIIGSIATLFRAGYAIHKSSRIKQENKEILMRPTVALVLFILIGVTWLSGTLAVWFATQISEWFFCISASVLGCFIFTVCVVTNKDVRFRFSTWTPNRLFAKEELPLETELIRVKMLPQD